MLEKNTITVVLYTAEYRERFSPITLFPFFEKSKIMVFEYFSPAIQPSTSVMIGKRKEFRSNGLFPYSKMDS